MPHAHVPLEETDQSIFRPSVLSIVDQIRDHTDIDKKVRVLFPGDIQTVAQKGSAMDGSAILPTFSSEESITISTTENYDVEHIGATPTDKMASSPIFVDNSLGIGIVPVYVNSEVEIKFTYKCQSKSKAERWIDEIRLRLSQLQIYDMHDAKYHYVIPVKVLKLLMHVHEKKEAIAGYGENYYEYMKRCFTPRMTLITDNAGKDKRYVVKEEQTDVIGEFGFGVAPNKPEKNNDNGTWTIDFEYKYMYNKVIALRVQYPIMVHNQLLDPIYSVIQPDPNDKDRKPLLHSGWTSMYKIMGVDAVNEALFDPRKTLHIPSFDTWRVPRLPYFRRFFSCLTVLCEMNQADKRELVNLTQLGDIDIQKDIVQWLKDGEHQYVFKEDSSFIHIRLFANEEPMPLSALTIDEDLNVRTVNEMDPRVCYRLCVFLHTNMERLQASAFERLATYPVALSAILSALDISVHQLAMGQNPYPRNEVTKPDMSVIYWLLTGKRLFHGDVWVSIIPRAVIEDIMSRSNVTDFIKNNLMKQNDFIIHMTDEQLAKRFKENAPMFLLKLRSRIVARFGLNTMNTFIYPVKKRLSCPPSS